MRDYDFYRQRLRVDKHRLDDDLEVHAQFMEEIGVNVARLDAKVTKLKREVEYVKAVTARQARADDPKATAAAIDSVCAFNRDCIKAVTAFDDATAEAAEWTALAKAWHQRGFDMKALGELYGHQYFLINNVSAHATSPRRALREASESVPQRQRQRLNNV